MFIRIALKMFVREVISGVLWLIPRLLFRIARLFRNGAHYSVASGTANAE